MTIKDVEAISEIVKPQVLAKVLGLTTTQGLKIKIKNKSNLSTEQIESVKEFIKENFGKYLD